MNFQLVANLRNLPCILLHIHSRISTFFHLYIHSKWKRNFLHCQVVCPWSDTIKAFPKIPFVSLRLTQTRTHTNTHSADPYTKVPNQHVFNMSDLRSINEFFTLNKIVILTCRHWNSETKNNSHQFRHWSWFYFFHWREADESTNSLIYYTTSTATTNYILLNYYIIMCVCVVAGNMGVCSEISVNFIFLIMLAELSENVVQTHKGSAMLLLISQYYDMTIHSNKTEHHQQQQQKLYYYFPSFYLIYLSVFTISISLSNLDVYVPCYSSV